MFDNKPETARTVFSPKNRNTQRGIKSFPNHFDCVINHDSDLHFKDYFIFVFMIEIQFVHWFLGQYKTS